MKKYLVEGQAPADPNAAQAAPAANAQPAATPAANAQPAATPTAPAQGQATPAVNAQPAANNANAAQPAPATDQNAQKPEENKEITDLNANALAFYQGLFNAIKTQCSGENMTKVIPFIKTANGDAQSPYNATAKELSDKVKALSDSKVDELANVPDALTAFKNVLDGLNGFLKAVADGQANAAQQQQPAQQ